MSQAGSSQDLLSGSVAPQDFEARHTRLRSEMVEIELCLRNTKGEVMKLIVFSQKCETTTDILKGQKKIVFKNLFKILFLDLFYLLFCFVNLKCFCLRHGYGLQG